MTGEYIFNIMVAVPHDLRKENCSAANCKSTNYRFDVLTDIQGFEPVPDFIKNINMKNGNESHQYTHNHIKRNLCKGIYKVKFRDWKGRDFTVIGPGHNCCHG